MSNLDLFPAPAVIKRPASNSSNISCPILGGDIPRFPIECPTDIEADDDFFALSSMDCLPLIRQVNWQGRSEIPRADPIVLDTSLVGIKSSGRFHFAARMACDSLASPSPSRSWFDPKIRRSVEASKFYAENPKTALALRKYIPPQFRPSAAKAVFQRFEAERVYDPCGGWGDRLTAALATESVQQYYVRDVNPLVFPGYAEQCRRYDPEGKVVAAMMGAEINSPAKDYFDLVFTSPPYYKIEKYHGTDQSHAKYKGIDNWLSGFLFPMVTHAMESLRAGGHMVINISDVYADHRVNKICGPMIQYSLTNLPCTLVGVWGYRLARRVNYRSDISGVSAEPVIVLKKLEAA